MKRADILKEIKKAFGSVPGWIKSFSDDQLEHMWGVISWQMVDTKLSARDKALVAFGAATANHCPY